MSHPVSPPWGMGGGGAPISSPPSFGMSAVGGPVNANGINLTIPLPEVLPIPAAHEFNIEGHVATAGVSAGPINIVNAAFRVPPNNLAVIRGVTFYITDMTTATNMVFSLLINGGAPAGYGGVTIFPRNAPFVANGFESMIRFNGDANIQGVFTNNDGGTYIVGVSFSGWYWPEASDVLWKSYGR